MHGHPRLLALAWLDQRTRVAKVADVRLFADARRRVRIDSVSHRTVRATCPATAVVLSSKDLNINVVTAPAPSTSISLTSTTAGLWEQISG